MDDNTRQNGFGAVEGLLCLILLTLVIFTGYYVWHSSRSANSTYDKVASSSSATSTSPSIYSGWKTYCDPSSKACFKYPQNWKLTASASIDAQLDGPNTSVHVSFASPANDFGAPMPFHVVSINTLPPPNSSLQVIGGYYPDDINLPVYYVVDRSYAQTHSLTVNKTSTDGVFLDFTNGNQPANFSAFDNSGGATGRYTTSQAEGWFSTSDAKTASLILQSLYFK